MADKTASKSETVCIEDRTKLLSMNQDEFDQDEGGWRAVSHKQGCMLEAADLIAEYRGANLESKELSILYWHEGQLRAFSGEVQTAIKLMERTGGSGHASWDYYVDATLAFLKNDKPSLIVAREKLLTLPKPDVWYEWAEEAKKAGEPEPEWPVNLSFVDGFIECFGRTYSESYGRCAQTLAAEKGEVK